MDNPLDAIPIWAVFLFSFAVVRLAIEAGHRVGDRSRRRGDPEDVAPVRTMNGALLTLVAFIMAFIFAAAASRFDTRKVLVVKEANAIGTAYLRADLLPSQHAIEAKRLLREYVDSRLEALDPEKIDAALARSEELQARLWEETLSVAHEEPLSVGTRLFTPALNEIFDLHTERTIAGIHNRLPASLWAILYLVASVAMAAVGYDSGYIGTRRPFVTTALSLSFSLVLMMIVDLDRAQTGMLRVSQQAMTDLQESLD